MSSSLCLSYVTKTAAPRKCEKKSKQNIYNNRRGVQMMRQCRLSLLFATVFVGEISRSGLWTSLLSVLYYYGATKEISYFIYIMCMHLETRCIFIREKSSSCCSSFSIESRWNIIKRRKKCKCQLHHYAVLASNYKGGANFKSWQLQIRP